MWCITISDYYFLAVAIPVFPQSTEIFPHRSFEQRKEEECVIPKLIISTRLSCPDSRPVGCSTGAIAVRPRHVTPLFCVTILNAALITPRWGIRASGLCTLYSYAWFLCFEARLSFHASACSASQDRQRHVQIPPFINLRGSMTHISNLVRKRSSFSSQESILGSGCLSTSPREFVTPPGKLSGGGEKLPGSPVRPNLSPPRRCQGPCPTEVVR